MVEVEPGLYSILIDGQSFEVRAPDSDVEIEDPRDPRTSGPTAGLEGQTNRERSNARQSRARTGGRRRRVERGQGLVVIEAMKMQNEMKSPKPGRSSR